MDINNGMDSKFRTEVSDMMTQTIVEVYEKGFKKGFEAGKLAEAEESVRLMGYGKQEFKSANQQRAELIEKAKKFVRRLESKVERFQWTISDRTIQILTFDRNGMLMSFGQSKCAPGDVFNEWIGKAIALARVLQLPVPVEFLKAVQPSEVVVGQRVLYGDFSYHTVANKIAQVIARENGLSNGFVVDALNAERSDGFTWVNENNIQKIIDDTNAQYEVTV